MASRGSSLSDVTVGGTSALSAAGPRGEPSQLLVLLPVRASPSRRPPRRRRGRRLPAPAGRLSRQVRVRPRVGPLRPRVSADVPAPPPTLPEAGTLRQDRRRPRRLRAVHAGLDAFAHALPPGAGLQSEAASLRRHVSESASGPPPSCAHPRNCAAVRGENVNKGNRQSPQPLLILTQSI